MPFISPGKLFSCLRYLNFCLDIFGQVGKRLDKKAKVNFKIYNVIIWVTNYYNTNIAKNLKCKGNQATELV